MLLADEKKKKKKKVSLLTHYKIDTKVFDLVLGPQEDTLSPIALSKYYNSDKDYHIARVRARAHTHTHTQTHTHTSFSNRCSDICLSS